MTAYRLHSRGEGDEMKMMNLFDGIFWGVVLIALGVWFLVRKYVPVNIPVFRIIIAVFFVYLGVRVLVHGPAVRDKNTVVFSQSEMSYGSGEKGNEYNMIFSSGNVDLSGIPVGDRSVSAEVNAIFASATLRLSPTVPARVHMTSAFGSVHSPDGRSVAFGDMVYVTPAYKAGAPALEVKAAAVFGSLRIEQ
jgi:hypothetical protein